MSEASVKVVMLNDFVTEIVRDGAMTMDEMVAKFLAGSPQPDVWEVFAKVVRNTDRYVLAMGSHALADLVRPVAEKLLKMEFLEHEKDDCIMALLNAGKPLPRTSEGRTEALNARRELLGVPPLPDSLRISDADAVHNCGDPDCEACSPEVN